MPYLYGISDTKFNHKTSDKQSTIPAVEFLPASCLARKSEFYHVEWPISMWATPETLVELSIRVVDKLPLPSVYEWTDKDIRLWICRFGFPQYMHTFRVNMIWGRKLLLLDADALSAMNIKDFDHIKRITYGIRMLFHFELTKFSHSVSLPDEKPSELYLLWHTQTGVNCGAVRRSDLYRRMQLIRERSMIRNHWDLVELWLHRERERKHSVLIGYNMMPQYRIDTGRKRSLGEEKLQECTLCMPPCDCNSNGKTASLPCRLKCLTRSGRFSQSTWLKTQKECSVCIPPCECHWPPRFYLTDTVLSCLKGHFSEMYTPTYDIAQFKPSSLKRWARLSL